MSLLLQLADLFQHCIRQSAEVVNQMISVERVLAFGKVESEEALGLEGGKELLQTGWPKSRSIDVEELSVCYQALLPLALEKISSCIPPGSRVGVV